jgi:hypothetical protein
VRTATLAIPLSIIQQQKIVDYTVYLTDFGAWSNHLGAIFSALLFRDLQKVTEVNYFLLASQFPHRLKIKVLNAA